MTAMPVKTARGVAALAVLTALLPALAQAQAATDPSLAWDRIEAMVPMRDGVRLQTEIYLPKGLKEKLPILFIRTPYGFKPDAKGYSNFLAGPWLQDLLRDGYLLAVQSIRGRFRSEGRHAYGADAPRERRDARATDEGTDAYDTVDWLLSHVPSNGRVGMLGVSTPGRLTAMAMLEPHPAVRAYSPQATPADNFMGDDDFHQGAFRAGAMVDFIYVMESGKEFAELPRDRYDDFEWYLRLGPLSNVDARLFHGAKPTWNDFLAHPSYDAYWRRRALPVLLSRPPAPVLHVGGWFDQEDLRGPQALFQSMERGDAKGWNHLVMGPWAHKTWREEDGSKLGRIDFGSATARYFREEVQAPFFACALKDRCDRPVPKAVIFQTGSNVWQVLDRWPPAGVVERSVYLRAGGRLAFEAGAAEAEVADAWVADPRSPVPYLPRPITHADWATWLVTDQRFAHARPDVLTFESDPLTEDLVLAGPLSAHLFLSTSGADLDVVAKLIDVLPEKAEGDPALRGYQLMVAGEILRGRFRRSFERPEPFTPGQVEEVTVDLLGRSHVFRKGHRIMVQVQASWFPLYDLNPQTWVPSIFQAREADFQPQTHRLHSGGRYPSRITFTTPKR
jgi:putative CocE/NonD family hydrolase